MWSAWSSSMSMLTLATLMTMRTVGVRCISTVMDRQSTKTVQAILTSMITATTTHMKGSMPRMAPATIKWMYSSKTQKSMGTRTPTLTTTKT